MTYKANLILLEKLTQQTRCWSCKHKFDKPIVLPVKKPVRGKFQPNVNVGVLWHMYDTHGLPPDTIREWITGSVYGMPLTIFGIRKESL